MGEEDGWVRKVGGGGGRRRGEGEERGKRQVGPVF